jgi:hypothetical protein
VASDVLEVLFLSAGESPGGGGGYFDATSSRKPKRMKPFAATSGGLLANADNSRQPKQTKPKAAEIMGDRSLRLSVHCWVASVEV